LTRSLPGCLLVRENDNISHKLLHMRFILQHVPVRCWLHEVTLQSVFLFLFVQNVLILLF